MTNLVLKPNRVTRDLDRFFEDFFSMPNGRTDTDGAFSPRVNIRETKDHVYLTFEVPGIDKKDIKVTVNDHLLTVSGRREFRAENKDENWVRIEMRSGQFSRSFTLPQTIDVEKIEADYRNGLLEIRLEKFDEVKPKEIEVKVG